VTDTLDRARALAALDAKRGYILPELTECADALRELVGSLTDAQEVHGA
jgi:hypothetical protein